MSYFGGPEPVHNHRPFELLDAIILAFIAGVIALALIRVFDWACYGGG